MKQYLGTLLTVWIIFNHSMDDYDIYYKVLIAINYPFSNFNGVIVEVWEEISNFISQFTGVMCTYPSWDWNESILVNWHPGVRNITTFWNTHGIYCFGCYTIVLSKTTGLAVYWPKHKKNINDMPPLLLPYLRSALLYSLWQEHDHWAAIRGRHNPICVNIVWNISSNISTFVQMDRLVRRSLIGTSN